MLLRLDTKSRLHTVYVLHNTQWCTMLFFFFLLFFILTANVRRFCVYYHFHNKSYIFIYERAWLSLHFHFTYFYSFVFIFNSTTREKEKHIGSECTKHCLQFAFISIVLWFLSVLWLVLVGEYKFGQWSLFNGK